MTRLEKAYKKYCKFRYYTILFIYTIKAIVELGFVEYAFKNIIIWSIASLSIVAYHFAKWYQLKHMKFRKHGFYKKRKKNWR